jgi:hypothetical protein
MTTADAVVTDTADVPTRTPIADVEVLIDADDKAGTTVCAVTVVVVDTLTAVVLVKTSGLSYLPES